MSVARKCDRCGTYHDNRIFHIDMEGPLGIEYDMKKYDLCPECESEFADFMNGVKPKDLLNRLQALFK